MSVAVRSVTAGPRTPSRLCAQRPVRAPVTRKFSHDPRRPRPFLRFHALDASTKMPPRALTEASASPLALILLMRPSGSAYSSAHSPPPQILAGLDSATPSNKHEKKAATLPPPSSRARAGPAARPRPSARARRRRRTPATQALRGPAGPTSHTAPRPPARSSIFLSIPSAIHARLPYPPTSLGLPSPRNRPRR